MARCRVDPSIQRQVIDGFDFPLGVYPVEAMQPKEGFTMAFEQADQVPPPTFEDREDGEAAEWPDRYVFDIVVKSSRVESLIRQLMAMLPGRVYPILDLLGNDAYREIDPYIAYDLVGIERFLDSVRRYRSFFLEDGMVGFGAMSEEPFFYVFVDEHKIVTVRVPVELKDRIEAMMGAFDLKQVEQLSGADAALHEHRGVLEAPADRPDLLTSEEIVEELIDTWGLELNIDPASNVDTEGTELGMTGWRCIARVLDEQSDMRYRESLLTAENLMTARELAMDDALSSDSEDALAKKPDKETADEPSADVFVLACERLRPEEFTAAVTAATRKSPRMTEERVWVSRWLD